MIRTRKPVGWGVAGVLGVVLGGVTDTGCQRPIEIAAVRVPNETLGPMRIAVAPAMNVSGSPHLDAVHVADLMASELGYVEDIEVIPVNRVLAVLTDQRRERVESPGHAFEIMKLLGADGMLLFAITEYDAYEPPVVAISAQLYGETRVAAAVGFNPVAESRFGAPARSGGTGSPMAPIAQSERVFDASHEWVCSQVKRFAKSRSADASPFGWRKYIASQRNYLRFCCYETIRSLVGTHDVAAEPSTSGK